MSNKIDLIYDEVKASRSDVRKLSDKVDAHIQATHTEITSLKTFQGKTEGYFKVVWGVATAFLGAVVVAVVRLFSK